MLSNPSTFFQFQPQRNSKALTALEGDPNMITTEGARLLLHGAVKYQGYMDILSIDPLHSGKIFCKL